VCSSDLKTESHDVGIGARLTTKTPGDVEYHVAVGEVWVKLQRPVADPRLLRHISKVDGQD